MSLVMVATLCRNLGGNVVLDKNIAGLRAVPRMLFALFELQMQTGNGSAAAVELAKTGVVRRATYTAVAG